jgi:hypothetical protein
VSANRMATKMTRKRISSIYLFKQALSTRHPATLCAAYRDYSLSGFLIGSTERASCIRRNATEA